MCIVGGDYVMDFLGYRSWSSFLFDCWFVASWFVIVWFAFFAK